MEDLLARVQLLCSRETRNVNTSERLRSQDKMKWNTDIKTYTTPKQRKIVLEIMNWCVDELGMSPRLKRFPDLKLINKANSELYGEYFSGAHKILIYPDEQQNLRRLVDTVIHEFTHSCQRFISVRYDAASAKHGYDKNPFEVEARKVARENRTACLKHLQKVFG